MQNFFEELAAVAREMGMLVERSESTIVRALSSSLDDVETSLSIAWAAAGKSSGCQPQLLFCILPSSSVSLYGTHISDEEDSGFRAR